MQEIAILLSSLAGVATAAAVRKIPSRPKLLSLGASSHIKSQISSLNIEKDLLTKTISRLYQADAEYSKIQRGRLLSKYQQQLGIVLAKLEKLEQSSQHPDLGPIGDGLITLMDQKLSKLDERLYELSSKIAVAEVKKAGGRRDEPAEAGKDAAKKSFDFEKPVVARASNTRQSFELTTLTRVSDKKSKFPALQNRAKETNSTAPNAKPKLEVKPEVQTVPNAKPKLEVKPEVQTVPNAKPKLEIVQAAAATQKVPAAPENTVEPKERKVPPKPEVGNPRDEHLDDDFDDSDDLDEIKGDIKKILSKIDQAEVE